MKKLSSKISKYLNFRVLLLLTFIVIFILISSAQENYIGIDDIPVSTLTSTFPGSVNTSEIPPTTTTPGPTFPEDTPTPPEGNIDYDEEPSIPSQILPIAIAAVIIILISLLFIRKRREVKKVSKTSTSAVATLQSRRQRFRTDIKTLVDVLEEFLEQGRFSEGIVFGFHHLDKNMKRVLGIKREAYLTPKEFSNSLDLPELIPQLNWLIQSFYLARYRKAEMNYDDLEGFIHRLKKMKKLSVTKADIEIVQTEILGEKE